MPTSGGALTRKKNLLFCCTFNLTKRNGVAPVCMCTYVCMCVCVRLHFVCNFHYLQLLLPASDNPRCHAGRSLTVRGRTERSEGLAVFLFFFCPFALLCKRRRKTFKRHHRSTSLSLDLTPFYFFFHGRIIHAGNYCYFKNAVAAGTRLLLLF